MFPSDFLFLRARLFAGVASAFLLAATSVAQVSTGNVAAQPRIRAGIDNAVRVSIPGSMPPRARIANDAGKVDGSMRIVGASLVFNRSDTQQAALDALLAAQQDPASPLFHQWLNPDDFAARFGMADADLAKVTAWLQSQGLTVDSVSRSRDRLTFTGTAAQIATAFQSELHYFRAGTETHFAPSGDLTVPAAIAGSVQAITNLSDFRAKPHVLTRAVATPHFTSGQTGSHFLQPGDISVIYDIKAAYNAGFTGAGQSIAVVGQSAVIASDITAFQNASGLTTKAPTIILQPGTGVSTIYSGDESESDLDLEYTGAIAKGASLYFIYTGSNANYGVFDAMTYAVTNRIAPIISVSYGECETALGQTAYNSYVSIFQQAAAQGQTIIASSGDDGSTDCYQFTSLTTAQRTALTVDFPADSPYVTGLGGTEFTAAAVASTNTQYWSNSTSGDIITSALSYMPEQVWNDSTSSGGISSGGGGLSIFATRPSWQSSSVPGISAIAGTARIVPDLSLASSPSNAGYLYCSSDSGSTGIQGSCSNGFRDGTNTYLTVAGGTSFAAPIFAGMVAIINQAKYATGQGLINPTLYSLASNSATYATAFHDIVAGGNQCTAGSTYCGTAGAASYAAGTGYDAASGLGSVDFNNLLNAWPSAATTMPAAMATVTLSAATSVPALATNDAITITVARQSSTSTATPTGMVTLSINGAVVATLPLTNGSATYTYSSAVAGQAVLVASYSGDANYAAATSNALLLQVAASGSFTLSASSPAVTAGSTTTSTITITPVNGYTGTVAFTVTASPTFANACYTVSNATVTGAGPVTATLTLITNGASCSSATALRKFGAVHAFAGKTGSAQGGAPHLPGGSPVPVGFALAGLMTLGLVGRRSRSLRGLALAGTMTVAGFALSGCGSGTVTQNNLPTPTAYAATGAYTILVQGTDTTNAANTAYTSFTLKVQ